AWSCSWGSACLWSGPLPAPRSGEGWKGASGEGRTAPGGLGRGRSRRPRGRRGSDRPARRANGRPGARDILALRGEAVPGPAPRGRRCGGGVRPHERGAGARVRVALERARTGSSGARAAWQDRVLGARSLVRPAPAVVRSGGARLPDSGIAAYGRVLELLGEARGHARTGAPPRLADGVLHAPRAPRAATLPDGGEPPDRGPGRRDQDGGGRVRGRVLWAPVTKHGIGVRETGAGCGMGDAGCV